MLHLQIKDIPRIAVVGRSLLQLTEALPLSVRSQTGFRSSAGAACWLRRHQTTKESCRALRLAYRRSCAGLFIIIHADGFEPEGRSGSRRLVAPSAQWACGCRRNDASPSITKLIVFCGGLRESALESLPAYTSSGAQIANLNVLDTLGAGLDRRVCQRKAL